MTNFNLYTRRRKSALSESRAEGKPIPVLLEKIGEYQKAGSFNVKASDFLNAEARRAYADPNAFLYDLHTTRTHVYGALSKPYQNAMQVGYRVPLTLMIPITRENAHDILVKGEINIPPGGSVEASFNSMCKGRPALDSDVVAYLALPGRHFIFENGLSFGDRRNSGEMVLQAGKPGKRRFGQTVKLTGTDLRIVTDASDSVMWRDIISSSSGLKEWMKDVEPKYLEEDFSNLMISWQALDGFEKNGHPRIGSLFPDDYHSGILDWCAAFEYRDKEGHMSRERMEGLERYANRVSTPARLKKTLHYKLESAGGMPKNGEIDLFSFTAPTGFEQTFHINRPLSLVDGRDREKAFSKDQFNRILDAAHILRRAETLSHFNRAATEATELVATHPSYLNGEDYWVRDNDVKINSALEQVSARKKKDAAEAGTPEYISVKLERGPSDSATVVFDGVEFVRDRSPQDGEDIYNRAAMSFFNMAGGSAAEAVMRDTSGEGVYIDRNHVADTLQIQAGAEYNRFSAYWEREINRRIYNRARRLSAAENGGRARADMGRLLSDLNPDNFRFSVFAGMPDMSGKGRENRMFVYEDNLRPGGKYARAFSEKKLNEFRKRARHAGQNVLLNDPAYAEKVLSFFDEVYSSCGEGLNIDHIVPLNSPFVAGMNCLENYQILNNVDNMKKGNAFWPQMPDYSAADVYNFYYAMDEKGLLEENRLSTSLRSLAENDGAAVGRNKDLPGIHLCNLIDGAYRVNYVAANHSVFEAFRSDPEALKVALREAFVRKALNIASVKDNGIGDVMFADIGCALHFFNEVVPVGKMTPRQQLMAVSLFRHHADFNVFYSNLNLSEEARLRFERNVSPKDLDYRNAAFRMMRFFDAFYNPAEVRGQYAKKFDDIQKNPAAKQHQRQMKAWYDAMGRNDIILEGYLMSKIDEYNHNLDNGAYGDHGIDWKRKLHIGREFIATAMTNLSIGMSEVEQKGPVLDAARKSRSESSFRTGKGYTTGNVTVYDNVGGRAIRVSPESNGSSFDTDTPSMS